MNPAETPSQQDIVRRHADNVVDAFPDSDLETLAVDLETDIDAYENDRDMTLAVVAELRRRLAAGVRKWPSQKR